MYWDCPARLYDRCRPIHGSGAWKSHSYEDLVLGPSRVLPELARSANQRDLILTQPAATKPGFQTSLIARRHGKRTRDERGLEPRLAATNPTGTLTIKDAQGTVRLYPSKFGTQLRVLRLIAVNLHIFYTRARK